MDATTYALMAYGLTAAISLAVVGLIVVINHVMGGNSPSDDE